MNMKYDFRTLVEATLPRFFSRDQIFNAGTSKNRIPFSYWDAILTLANDYPEDCSLFIDFRHIEFFDQELAKYVRNSPEEFLKACTETIRRIPLPINKELIGVEARIINLPDVYVTPISKLRKNHLGKFVSVVCTVSKVTEIRPKRKVAAFLCVRCSHVNLVPQPEETDILLEPFSCEGETCGKKGPFKILNTEGEFVDIQYLKVQEPVESLRGRQPEYLYVTCTEDITGACQPGEKVIITGVLQGKTRIKKEGKTQLVDFVLIANSIVKSKKDFENIDITLEEEEEILELTKREDFFSLVSNSIAPSIFGHEKIKQGIALQLFSGIREDNGDGTFIRGDVHILLFGDPGIAKSQFLKFVASFAPRANLVSGQSATGAGLTGAAVHDDFNGRWSIECGALSLVSGGEDYEGGICCVDEMDKMSEKDRSAMHGALEQQSVDVAKAGIVAHMPTRCALLGAANPKYGRYDPYENIASQFNLGPAMLSRMDLIYVIRDIPDQEFDFMLARHILEKKGNDTTAIIDLELLRKIIAYAKTHCFPEMSQDAIDYITEFYVKTRNASEGAKDAPPVTVRVLHAARRLAISHARIRLSNTVDKKDAKIACDLLLSNLHEVGIDPDTGALDSAVLEAGTSKSQRESIKKIREIVEKISKADLVLQAAKLDMVIEKSKEAGVKDPEGLIKKMKRRGDLMSPTRNTLKLVI